MKLLRKAGAIFDGIINRLSYLAIALLVFSWLAVCFHVLFRYFLRQPFKWTVEVSGYTLLWITFLGATWLLKREGHVRLDIVLNRLNPRARALLNVITSIIGAVVCLVIAYYGGVATWDAWIRGVVPSTPMAPLKAPILMIICIGSFLLFVQFLRRAYGYLASWKLSQDKGQRS